MSIRAPLLLLLVTAPTSIVAQGGPGGPWHYSQEECVDDTPENTIHWPPSVDGYGSASSFARIVIAELDGDNAPEGVLNVGGLPVTLWNLSVYEALQRVEFDVATDPTNVADIATLPGAGPYGTDAVVMTDGRGLFQVTYEDPDEDGIGTFIPQMLDGTVWAGAAPIHVDDVNEDGYLDVIGVAFDRRWILTCMGSASGFQPGVAVNTPYITRDALAVDFDHDGTRDLVALTIRGLYFYTAAGAYIPNSALIHLSATGCIARVHSTDAGGNELLAWTRAPLGNPGGAELLVVGQGVSEGPWLLTFTSCASGPIQPTAMLAGRYDLDENDDLLLTYENNQTAIALANLTGELGATQRFNPAIYANYDAIALSDTPEDAGDIGIPAFTQIDGEGPDDLVFPMAVSEEVRVHLSVPYVKAVAGQHSASEIVSDKTEFGPRIGGGNELRLAFTVPDQYKTYFSLEVLVWKQSSPPNPISTPAVANLRYVLLNNGAEVTTRYQWVRLDYDFQAACEPNPCFYVEVRFAKSPIQKSPIYSGGFRLEDCNPAVTNEYQYLTDMGEPPFIELYEHSGLTDDPDPLGREMLGFFIPLSELPPFPNDSRPAPGIPASNGAWAPASWTPDENP